MIVGTESRRPSAPGFSDRRDPAILGWALLVRAREDGAPLSETYDRHAAWFERVPPWTGDGLMSNDPSKHHSKTPQTPAPGGNQ